MNSFRVRAGSPPQYSWRTPGLPGNLGQNSLWWSHKIVPFFGILRYQRVCLPTGYFSSLNHMGFGGWATPLKKMSQLGWWHSQFFWENAKNGNQTTNQIWDFPEEKAMTAWWLIPGIVGFLTHWGFVDDEPPRWLVYTSNPWSKMEKDYGIFRGIELGSWDIMIGFTGKFTLQSGFSYLAVPWQQPLVLGEACRVKARIAHLRRELGGDTSIN